MQNFVFAVEVRTKLAVKSESYAEAAKQIKRLMGTDLNISYENPDPPVMIFSGVVNRPATLIEIDGQPLIIE